MRQTGLSVPRTDEANQHDKSRRDREQHEFPQRSNLQRRRSKVDARDSRSCVARRSRPRLAEAVRRKRATIARRSTTCARSQLSRNDGAHGARRPTQGGQPK